MAKGSGRRACKSKNATCGAQQMAGVSRHVNGAPYTKLNVAGRD